MMTKSRRTKDEDFILQARMMAKALAKDPLEETVWLMGGGYVLPGTEEQHRRIAGQERLES